MNDNRDALVLNDVEAGYGSTFVLSGISFRAARGEVVGLIGPNGGGKSTLLKAIAGVIPLRSGTVAFDGRPLRDLTGRVAFVPQRDDVNWEFPATALDVVLMGRYRSAGWLRRPGRKDRELAREALARLGLEGKEGRHISQFSGGQQQRIFLARAMVQDPVIVLLDEPFTGIDQANRELFHAAIRDFAERGCVILMATHDLDEVASACSSVACINNRLVAFGPTETTYTAEVLRTTFGGRVAVFAP